MFAKPYKQKSNNTLKNCEKKQLVQRILDEFPSVSEEKAKQLVPVKASGSCMKLVLHSGEAVGVYVIDGAPLLIDTELGLVPTVCALWKLPELVPTITIHTPVLPKVLGGAPLYLPGVTVPAGGVGFPMFARGAVLAARTSDNAAAALVGRAALSSGDMLLRAAGVCLECVHVYGDLLCKEAKFCKVERPQCGPASYSCGDPPDRLADDVSQLNIKSTPKEEWPSLGRHVPPPPAPAPAPRDPPAPPPPPAPHAPHAPRVIADEPRNDADADHTLDITEECASEEDGVPEDMDGLLRWCLLSFLKLEGKRVELPLKTNLLYKNHLFPLCPPDRTLDVKKSSYKKMGKFLEAMQQEGLVEVREIDKGVDALVALSSQHEALRRHRAPPARAPAPPAPPARAYRPPAVRELYCVTAAVLPLFPGLKKGAARSGADVRAALAAHVRARGLAAPPAPAAPAGAVTLDALLAGIAARPQQEWMKWDALTAAVLSRMTAATELVFADGAARLSKARLDPVTMQVATRSGNKKVTLVSNLEAYGFSLPALSHACQLGVGASCGVTRSPGAKADQLMLQGDQTHFVAKLLIEKYGLPKKFVDGADKALNKKK